MTDVFALEKLSAAKRAIAEAQTVPDAKKLLDQFSVLADYAKRQKLELEVQQEIAACRLWTRRKLGAMLEEMPKATGAPGNQYTGKMDQYQDGTSPPKTLADIGISRAESSRLQSEASMPESVVTEYIEEAKEAGEEITTAGLHRKARALDVTAQSVQVTIFSHESKEYYTPPEYIEAARDVMGAIDLDPASCDRAQGWIKAITYYTAADDGLEQPWRGRVWLNPPYSKSEGKSNQETWSQRLIAEYQAGNVTEAILLVKAALGYKWFEDFWCDWPVCFGRERLSFIKSDGSDEGQSKQGSAFFYFGPNVERFKSIFGKFGRVILPEIDNGR